MEARDDEPKRLRETLEAVDDTAGTGIIEEAVHVLPRRILSEKKHRNEERRLPEDAGAEAEAGDDGREKARGADQTDLAVEAADADEIAENLKHDLAFLEKLANNGMMTHVDMRGIGEEFDDVEQLTAEIGAKRIVEDLCAGGNEKLTQERRVCVEDFGSSRAETNEAGLIEEDDGDEDEGKVSLVPALNTSEHNEARFTTRPMLAGNSACERTLLDGD